MLCDISNPLDNNNQGRCLLDIGDIFDLDSLNNTPTRISSQRSSCLDVILTNVPGYFRESGILEVGVSDHYLVYTILNRNYAPNHNLKPKLSGCTLPRTLMKALFVATLVWFLFRRLNCVFDDPDGVYWAWEKFFFEVLDNHVPVKSFRRRDQFQFINPELREVMRERNRCKKQFNKSRKLQLKSGKSTAN